MSENVYTTPSPRYIRVLFICWGNICRSPMAEFILKKMVADAGRQDEFFISSAATSSEEVWNGRGNPIYPPARAELKKHGIMGAEVDAKRAVQITRGDYEKYDYIICMEQLNVSYTLRIVGADPEGKIHKLLDFGGSGRDVADPWYSDRFDVAYSDIYAGCKAFLEQIS